MAHFLSAMLARLALLLTLLLSIACLLPQSQTNSLQALFNATRGTFWYERANWMSNLDPCTSPWYGIYCDNLKENVVRIDLSINNLFGSLPDLQLPALETL